MAELVYLLCGLASAFCAALLLRSYRRAPVRLALWTSICFVGLAVENLLVFVDFIIVPTVDLAPLRTGVALAAATVLVVAMIREGT